MGILKFLVWTACAVGLGFFLATAKVDGRTPWDWAQRTWKRQVQSTPAPRVERMKEGVREALDDAEEAVQRTTKQVSAAPRERITHEDRAAIERIIAQKK